jgi:type I restriction enzyme, R subunit
MHAPNQNPEQIARDKIDQLLTQSGWLIQPNKAMNLNAAFGVAVYFASIRSA